MTGPNETAIAEIRARVAAASEGPWTLSRDERGARAIATGRPDGRRFYIKRDLIKRYLEPASEADVAFIALARTALPTLVEAIANDEADLLAADEIERIEETVAAASAGPWTAFLEDRQPIGGPSMIWAGDDPHAPDMYVFLEDEIAPSADLEFIASAREDIPALLSEIRYRRRNGHSSHQ